MTDSDARHESGVSRFSGDEWQYGDDKVGYDVPKTVREGGATGPMLKSDIGEIGVAYEGHSARYECVECGDIRRFVTPDFMTMYRCQECGDVRWFEFKWGLNR